MEKSIALSYLVFICLFSYLPKSVDTIGFILFIFYAIYFYICRICDRTQRLLTINKETKRLRILFAYFILFASFYFLISFFNLPRLWNIKGLDYSLSYLPRHYFAIAELFIPIVLSFGFYKLKLYHRLKLAFLIPFALLLFLINSDLCVKGLLLIALSIIAWKCHCKLIMLFAFFLNLGQSAYILGFFVLILVLLFEKQIIPFLSKNTTLKIIFILFAAIFGVFLSYGWLMAYVKSDPNSLWRLMVWLNEFDSLSKTWFTGVGFGSAYVTRDIVYQVSNSNMYTTNVDGGLDTGIFIVANHSSLLNMFYRMGILGGMLFLALNVQLIRVVVITYHRAVPEMKRLLWYLLAAFIYETIIISLNPGLEMMQFALSYILSLSVLLAVIMEIQNQRLFVENEK